MDKLIVEVIEVKKGLDPFYSIRGFLVADSFYLFNVNFDSFYSNNEFKVLYIFYPKFTFFNVDL
jgi:hypothetical protein